MRHKVVEKPVEEGTEKGGGRERERERKRKAERESARNDATEGKPLRPNHPSRFLATPASRRRSHVAGRSRSCAPSRPAWGMTGGEGRDVEGDDAPCQGWRIVLRRTDSISRNAFHVLSR